MVQSDLLNATRLATVLVVPLTRNLRWADAPGNVRLTAKQTGLPQDSAANVTQLTAVDRTTLQERTGKLRRPKLDLILDGIAFAFGR